MDQTPFCLLLASECVANCIIQEKHAWNCQKEEPMEEAKAEAAEAASEAAAQLKLA